MKLEAGLSEKVGIFQLRRKWKKEWVRQVNMIRAQGRMTKIGAMYREYTITKIS